MVVTVRVHYGSLHDKRDNRQLLSIQADDTLSNRRPHVDPVMEVMEELRNLTEETDHVYPTDLFQGSDMMNEIAGKAAGLSQVHFKVRNFSQVWIPEGIVSLKVQVDRKLFKTACDRQIEDS